MTLSLKLLSSVAELSKNVRLCMYSFWLLAMVVTIYFSFFIFVFLVFWYHLWYIFLSVADLGPVLSHLVVKGLLPTGGIEIFRHAVRQGDELILAIVLLLSDHRSGMLCVRFDIVWCLFGSV